MGKYNIFFALFIISVIAFIFFMGFYIRGVFSFVSQAHENAGSNPWQMFSAIFNPALIIAFAVMALSSLACRIFAIVLVVKNKTVNDGEKAIWIVGFILMYFITAIVFLILARGRKFVE